MIPPETFAVFVTGGDKIGWALDTDARTIQEAIRLCPGLSVAESISEATVILSVSYRSLLRIPSSILSERLVIAQISQAVDASLKESDFAKCCEVVDCWFAPTEKALSELKAIGLNAIHTPYLLPDDWFVPDSRLPVLPTPAAVLDAKVAGRLIVGNFHRDTEGRDLRLPKPEKGPDLFAELLAAVEQQRPGSVFALLAGPRRHWIRERLDAFGVPYHYCGKPVHGDDIKVNTLSEEVVRGLYRFCDAYLVTSRSEGGPRTLLEAAACDVPLLSTPVGLANELLPEAAVIRNLSSGIRLLTRLIDSPREYRVPRHALEKHRVSHSALRLGSAIRDAARLRKSRMGIGRTLPQFTRADSFIDLSYKVLLSLRHKLRPRRRSSATISIWYEFHKPPYGGGNQFAIGLEAALSEMGYTVCRNEFSRHIDAYILNGFWFDEVLFQRVRGGISRPVLHRVDGPSSIVRGDSTPEVDLKCEAMNRMYATHTVLQSTWSARALYSLGLRFRRPVVIHNAADYRHFFRHQEAGPRSRSKFKIIASSWSSNVRKGGPVYKQIAEGLDSSKYEFTFIGRCSEDLPGARVIEPLPSRELGEALRAADIYLTASQKDPCSNALIEALSCGLPAAFLRDGGHPELVEFGGVGFDDAGGALDAIERIAGQYERYRRLIRVPDMFDVARRYLGHIGITTK